jgi:hypothetical protein
VIVCVYALITPSRLPRRVKGVAGEPLRAMTVDGIVAVVGEVRRPPAASTRNLRRFASIIESIAGGASAILPARFGSTFTDVTELMLVLRSRRGSIRERLRAVRGRAQMTIRLVGSDPGDASIRGQTPMVGRSGVRPRNKATQGTRYLQEQLAKMRTAREIPELAPVRAAVRRLVREERVERRRSIATVHHLIPRAAAGRYGAAVARTAAENGVRLTVSGPWAPYAFAENW